MQIYLITNLVTGTLYVGQTRGSLRRRWKRHLSQSRNGSSLYLHRSIRKYGVENFTIVPLRPIEFDITTEDELNGWEREMIRALRNTNQLYNLTDGGAGTIGFPRSGSRGTFTKGHIPWMRGKHHSGEREDCCVKRLLAIRECLDGNIQKRLYKRLVTRRKVARLGLKVAIIQRLATTRTVKHIWENQILNSGL